MSKPYVFDLCREVLRIDGKDVDVWPNHAACPGSRVAPYGTNGGAICACWCHASAAVLADGTETTDE